MRRAMMALVSFEKHSQTLHFVTHRLAPAARPETIKRPRGETAEQKKARKEAVKQERASRRAEKKSTKETFGNEFKRQKRIAGKAVAGGAAADIKVGEGVRRLA